MSVTVINCAHILLLGWETSETQSGTLHTDIQGSIQICLTTVAVWIKSRACKKKHTMWVFVELSHRTRKFEMFRCLAVSGCGGGELIVLKLQL